MTDPAIPRTRHSWREVRPGRTLRRFGQYALVLWAAGTINFALPRLAKGDPVVYLYQGDSLGLSPTQLAQVRAEYGLDRPVAEQYLMFWSGLVRGDLGLSVKFNRPVLDVVAERFPWTLVLVTISLGLGLALGIALGGYAAWRRGSRRDTALVTGVLAVDAMPGFWLAMTLVAVFAVGLGWFPSYSAAPIGEDGLAWWLASADRLVLPVATVTLTTVGAFFLLTRAATVAVLDEPFVRLARAKGLTERRIVVSHALRNALLPVYTNATVEFGKLLSGVVVVETVLSYPGIGRLVFEAVTARDYPLLQGLFLLLTVGVVAVNLLAELSYPLLDPRVRHDSGADMTAVPT